ncbi:hypothetical protein AB3R30_21495 [Leptolyngbyaceae cyanobacterium UHCC 1019]
MSWKSFVAASLFLSAGLSIRMLPAISAPVPTMTVAAWQPIARINPTKPFQVQIINKTRLGLEYSSTTNEFPPRKLAANATTTLKQLSAPIYLLISPLDGRFNLKYTVSTRDNLVVVTVTQLPDSNPGNTTVNVQETGGIFVY